MLPTAEIIEHLFFARKQCLQRIKWHKIADTYHFESNLYLDEDIPNVSDPALLWKGFFNSYVPRVKQARWGFSILYMSKFVVRSWDLSMGRHQLINGGSIRGSHKHRFASLKDDRRPFKIPLEEISQNDPNKSIYDFAAECNIDLTKGYDPLVDWNYAQEVILDVLSLD